MPNSITPVLHSSAGETAVQAGQEFVVTVRAKARESADVLLSRLALELKKHEATILALFVYGDVAAREQVTKLIRRYLGAIDWPMLWVEGQSCNGALVAGIQAFAIHGTEVERLLVNGRVVATTYDDGGAKHCLLAGLGPNNPRAGRAEQTGETFENLRTALDRIGFDFCDIARTWFYNERLLDWYDAFNGVRTTYYAQRPFCSGAVPASTGVAGRNPAGAALAVAAWAVQPSTGSSRVAPVESPRQCAALQYGSSFSRAMEIESGGWRRLLISGTASIGPDGRSLWRGDIGRQVGTTMEVVAAMLESRGMHFTDVIRATAYFKFPLDTAAFEDWQVKHELSLPAVYVHCDICRDDLLFEIEVDAAVDSAPTAA